MVHSRIRILSLALLATLATACASMGDCDSCAPDDEDSLPSLPDPDPPVLLKPNTTYELTAMASAGKTKTVGFAFAEKGKKPGQQTLRWLLLEDFVSPTSQDVWIHELLVGPNGSKPPATVDGFVDLARKSWKPGSIYAKSAAETHRELRETRSGSRSVIPVPWPKAPPAPKPKGDLPLAAGTGAAPAAPAGAGAGAVAAPGDPESDYQQSDDGTVGIRPGGINPDPIPVPPPTPVPPPGPDPFDHLAQSIPQGIVGFGVAGPMLKSNVEYWFISKKLFPFALHDTTIGPYRVIGGVIGDKALTEWAVVVVSSSYYRKGIPGSE